MRIAVNGAAGAMGRRMICRIAEREGLSLAAALERADHPDLGADVGTLAGAGALGVPLSSELRGDADVLVDFSAPAAAVARAAECAEKGVPIVIGTTGLSAAQLREIRESAAAKTPVLMAPNMSIGVNLLFRLVEEVASALPEGYDLEIIETHHRRKRDAPSGTALEIGRRACRALGREPDAVMVYGRQGAVGPRSEREVAIHAVRGGTVVGDHTVMFAGRGERLELTHRAESRDVFVEGALRAAEFLATQGPGLYSMDDVLS
jgi:4-hydroxy-tetrahydrodipicolinate reductase